MVREKHVFLGNSGAGKSTLINCLIGKLKLKAGQTDKYQTVKHKGITYMDTPGLATEQIVKEAAEQITKALQQGGTYKLFFFVRLQSGRVLSEDITTLDRVLDAIKIDDRHKKYTVVINNIRPGIYNQLAQRGDEFNKVKQAVNHKYHTDSFCLVEQIEELDDAENRIARLPQNVHQYMKHAPAIRIESRQVEPIDVRGLQQQIAQLERELAEMRRAYEDLLASSNRHSGRGERTAEAPELDAPTTPYTRATHQPGDPPPATTTQAKKRAASILAAAVVIAIGVSIVVTTQTKRTSSSDASPTTAPPASSSKPATSPAVNPPPAPSNNSTVSEFNLDLLFPKRCFTSTTTTSTYNYGYKVCFDTGQATQDNAGGVQSVGTMASYDTGAHPSHIDFVGGDMLGCDGQRRSLHLELQCAPTYELLNVNEMSTCFYNGTFTSPGMCKLSNV